MLSQYKYVRYIDCVFPQEELEHLNEASAEINKLELQLDVSVNT